MPTLIPDIAHDVNKHTVMFILSISVLVIDIVACLRQTATMAEHAIYKAFGRAVATRRRELDLTQSELAARVRMSRASVANIESGRQSVLLHHVYGLAEALEITKVSDLLPAPSKPPTREDIDMIILSDEDVTPRAKAQITDLIASALAQRSTKKAGS
jgi:transcriptional regulator with XRE-family HTH domain